MSAMSAATKAEENAGAIVYEVLGRRALDVDTTIIEYIINVLKDESFDFGVKGEGAFQAVGELLIDSGCVDDEPEARLVCGKLSEKIGSHGQTGKKEVVRSLTTPVRMYDGLCQEEPPPKKVEIEDGPPMSERDRAKLERRRRKDERQREVAYELHLEEMKASLAGMPVAHVHHGNGDEGSTVKDIHMTNFNISVGGRELIKDGSITLSYGRHYGLIGRNGTGKTTLLRHMALHAIDGIPKNCQILHVEQEVVGDDTIAIQCVLNSDVERTQLLEEEARLVAQQRDVDKDVATEKGDMKLNGATEDKDISERLQQIYKRLEYIDADSAESRAASILAGLSFTPGRAPLTVKFIRKMKVMKIIGMAIAIVAALLASISVVRGAIQICNVDKDDLMPCKPAVTQPPAQPVQACCSVLSTANLTCFCEFGNNYPSLLRMFGIDPDLAKALPGECKLNSPPGC